MRKKAGLVQKQITSPTIHDSEDNHNGDEDSGGSQPIDRTDNDQDVPAVGNDQDVPIAGNDQNIPVASNDQDVPTTSSDQDVPIASNDQGVPAASNEQDVPITGAVITKVLFQGSPVMIKNTVTLDDLIGHLNAMLIMLHTDTRSVILCGGSRCNR